MGIRINILLATFNGEAYLYEQLNSLFIQDYQDFKVLIRDDGSTDNTVAIIKHYQNRYPEKIQFIIDDVGNVGSSESFMMLLSSSDSKYVMFCDQDDVWLPGKISASLKAMNEIEELYAADIPLLVFTDLKVVDCNLGVIKSSYWEYQKLIPGISKDWEKLLAQNVITGCTVIINDEARKVCLPFSLNMMMHDQWLGVNVAKFGKIHYLTEQTVLYRQHKNNVEGAHNYGLNYIFIKFWKLSRVLNKLNLYSNYYNDTSILKLIYYKILINMKRLVR